MKAYYTNQIKRANALEAKAYGLYSSLRDSLDSNANEVREAQKLWREAYINAASVEREYSGQGKVIAVA